MAKDPAMAMECLGERWAFAFKRNGHHYSVTVRHGEPGHRAFLGTLTMNEGEAKTFEGFARWSGAHVEKDDFPNDAL
jgi:hypothetical protein